MCDIKFRWLFNLLVAVVLIIQQQQYVNAAKEDQQQQHKYISPYDDISSYAAASAANYLRRNSLPHKEVKREIKQEKTSDFISYMNDFNMQDETSIPEDIIDQQHLQEIIDKQQQGIQQEQQPQEKLQQKFVVGKSAAGASVLNGDGDIIDVNLPYDDSTDTDSDADIILESQGSTEDSGENKTSHSHNNNYSSSENVEENEMLLQEKHDKDKHEKNFEKINNKEEMFKANKISKSKADYKIKAKKKQKIINENNMDYSNHYNSYDEVKEKYYKNPVDDDADRGGEIAFDEYYDDDVEKDYDDDGSAEYERFKRMHAQKEKERREQQTVLVATQNSTINERTFNTPYSSDKMVDNRDNDKIQHMLDDTDDNNNKNKNLNDYEIFHKHLLEQRQKLLQQQNQQSQIKQDAIGDIEDDENPNIIKTTASIYNSDDENKNNLANTFIPRKTKRHNTAARSDDASSNKLTRLKQEEEESQQQQQQFKSQINTEGKHSDVVAKVSTQEENFKKKYYDILKENSTSNLDHHAQQHHHHPPLEEPNPEDLSFYDENNEKEQSHEVKRQTAFEKEKSLRISSKRYGHKSHKKKYKDYLRYSQIMMMTTTSSTPTLEQNFTKTATNISKDNHEHTGLSEDDISNLNALKDKHIKKLKFEKIKALIPPAPIFVLKDHKEKDKKEDVKQQLEEVEEPATKAFYEGQINYFLETPDDDSERANEVRFITKGERVDTNDWYRKLSPVLRNGNKKVASAAEERSGIGVGRSRAGYSPYHHYRPQHQVQSHHGQTRNHHYHQQHHHHHQQQQHGRSAHHHQISKLSRHHAYQRKMIPKHPITTTTPMPPPSRKQLGLNNGMAEMGHQITDIKDLDRYYAKWPHLARVQSQLHEEQMREQQMENYPDYEYDSDDYFEDNDSKDDNLPPYIRKFNRRNKQLLDLLEGTIAPPTKSPQQLRWSGSKQQTQSASRDSSVGSMTVRIDDDYLKEKRKRYHQRQRQIQDLFAQQKTSTTTHSPPPYTYVNANTDGAEMTARKYLHTENHLPDEDVSISLESNEQEDEHNSQNAKQEDDRDDDNADDDDDGDANNNSKAATEIWQKEIETKSANMAAGNSQITNWQMEKLITSTPAAVGAAVSKKSAIYKLPSYPSIAGGYMNRPRSRSAQFAPNSGSEFRRAPTSYTNNLNNNNDNINNNNNNFINVGNFVAYNRAPGGSKQINGRYSANAPNDYNRQQQSVLNTTTTSSNAAKIQSSSSSYNNQLHPPPSSMTPTAVTNSFIYHRVIDASPRLVGAGFIAGRKQRLPFVAITDRRLETSKKSLTDHQKDFEQNHYPLP